VTVVALSAGCAKSTTSGSTGSGGGSSARIGIIVAETGPLAGAGRSWLQGATIAANHVNDQGVIGSGRKIELVKKEGSEDPAKSASVAAQLAADKSILGLACCILSPVAGAVKPIAIAQKVPLDIWGATEPNMAQLPYVIRTTTMPQPANEVIGKTVAEKKSLKSAAYSVMTDNAGIVSQAAAFKKGLESAGVSDLGQVGILSKQTDFTSTAAQLIQKNPESIVVAATQSEAVGMIAALHDKGYQGQIITGETVVGTGVFKSQPDALDKVPFPVYYLASAANSQGKKFADDYKKQYGADPDDFAAQGYNAIWTMAVGLKAAGDKPTRESLIKALGELKSVDNTIYGTVTFNGGQLDASAIVKIVSYTKPNGEIQLWNG
jgi:ABC-type branched-subunit amino acid transport system substrate-binding protein